MHILSLILLLTPACEITSRCDRLSWGEPCPIRSHKHRKFCSNYLETQYDWRHSRYHNDVTCLLKSHPIKQNNVLVKFDLDFQKNYHIPSLADVFYFVPDVKFHLSRESDRSKFMIFHFWQPVWFIGHKLCVFGGA